MDRDAIVKRYWKQNPPDYDAMHPQDRHRIAREEAAKACPAFRRMKNKPDVDIAGKGRRQRITSVERRERLWRIKKWVERMKRRAA